MALSELQKTLIKKNTTPLATIAYSKGETRDWRIGFSVLMLNGFDHDWAREVLDDLFDNENFVSLITKGRLCSGCTSDPPPCMTSESDQEENINENERIHPTEPEKD